MGSKIAGPQLMSLFLDLLIFNHLISKWSVVSLLVRKIHNETHPTQIFIFFILKLYQRMDNED